MKSYFSQENSLIYNYQVKLGERIRDPLMEGDLVVKVVHKEELEDKIVYFVMDETDACELHTYKYFNFVSVNDVIRIRSYRLYDK